MRYCPPLGACLLFRCNLLLIHSHISMYLIIHSTAKVSSDLMHSESSASPSLASRNPTIYVEQEKHAVVSFVRSFTTQLLRKCATVFCGVSTSRKLQPGDFRAYLSMNEHSE